MWIDDGKMVSVGCSGAEASVTGTEAAAAGTLVVFAGFREDNGLALLHGAMGDAVDAHFFSTLDVALEWCEDTLLANEGLSVQDGDELPLQAHPMLEDLTPAELRGAEVEADRQHYRPGDRIIRQGDAADCVYLLTAGTVGVHVALADGSDYRLATIGPGAVFGELALMDAEPRAAAVDAETDVVCYALRVASLEGATQAKLVAFLARHLAARLRRADREIAALAS